MMGTKALNLGGRLTLGLWLATAGWGCGTEVDEDPILQVEIGPASRAEASGGDGTQLGTKTRVGDAVDEPIDDGTTDSGDDPNADPADEPVDDPNADPADEPVDDPNADPADEPVDDPNADPADEPVDDPNADPADEPVDDPNADPADEPVDDPNADPADDALPTVEYVFEFTEEKPWLDLTAGTSETETVYVSSYLYVPGSHSLTPTSVPIYVTTSTSGANSLGDVVGSVYNVYAISYAFADPYDEPIRYLYYPGTQVIATSLVRINDDRLAIGSYTTLGGYKTAIIYDLEADSYTTFRAPDTAWTELEDLNSAGRLIGVSINDDGASRTGFVYDCQNGFHGIQVPDADWTVPQRIDADGAIYGYFSGPGPVGIGPYFIARPTSEQTAPSCSLTDPPPG
jgi:hypothetical protein